MRQSLLVTERGEIPCFEWPTHSQNPVEPIQLCAANGLPVACYGEFIDQFLTDFQVSGIDNRGAWPEQPKPADDWRWNDHADDLIAAIEAHHRQAVIGIGHSIGGTVTLLAAAKRPELFSRLVVIDAATTPSKLLSRVYHLLPAWLSFKLFKFIRGSHQREIFWSSPQSFFEHYRDHPTYRHFTERSLYDYSVHGLRRIQEGEYALRFQPAWESYNFRRVHYLWDVLARITHPTLLLRAEHSYLYTQPEFEQRNLSLPLNIEAQVVPDTSHLVALEHPRRLARQILSWLQNSQLKR